MTQVRLQSRSRCDRRLCGCRVGGIGCSPSAKWSVRVGGLDFASHVAGFWNPEILPTEPTLDSLERKTNAVLPLHRQVKSTASLPLVTMYASDDLRLSEFYKSVQSSSWSCSNKSTNALSRVVGIMSQHLSQRNHYQAGTIARMRTRIPATRSCRATSEFRLLK
jgi:hypothetical protein